jgi:hypothetical protein
VMKPKRKPAPAGLSFSVYKSGTSANQASQSNPILGKAPVNSNPLKAAINMFFFLVFNFRGFVKSLNTSFDVIPAKAVIQCFQIVMDACLRRHDGILNFLRVC